MTTSAERAVIAAARYLADTAPVGSAVGLVNLQDALAALDVAEAPAEPGAPQEITWGEVVSQDEVLSSNRRWYEVLEIRTNTSGITTVRFKGLKKPFTKPAGDLVTVKRSDMGEAVDTLNRILLSGPS